jgi:hypothetical protein
MHLIMRITVVLSEAYTTIVWIQSTYLKVDTIHVEFFSTLIKMHTATIDRQTVFPISADGILKITAGGGRIRALIVPYSNLNHMDDLMETIDAKTQFLLNTTNKSNKPLEWQLIVEPENSSATISLEYNNNKMPQQYNDSDPRADNKDSWWSTLTTTYKALVIIAIVLIVGLIGFLAYLAIKSPRSKTLSYFTSY